MADRHLTRKQREQQEAGLVRRPKVYALRVAGAQFADIARQLSVSLPQVYADYHEYMAGVRAEHEQEAETIRDLEDSRLEMAMLAIVEQVRRGHLGAIREWRNLLESRRKLWGLDAPVKTTVSLKDDDASLVARGRALGLIGEDHPS